MLRSIKKLKGALWEAGLVFDKADFHLGLEVLGYSLKTKFF